MLIKSLFLFICCIFVKSNDDKNCLDQKIEKYLATKTPYRFINNRNDNKVEFKGKLKKLVQKKNLTSLFSETSKRLLSN